MLKPYLELGQIVGTHGVKGEVRLNPWCDAPQFIKKFKTVYFDENGNEKIAVKSARPHGNIVILSLDGVDTMEKAQSLRNKVLYMKREDANLPENTWFIEDLIGCEVRQTGTDKVYGKISDIQKYPANDVWTVKSDDGRETLIPAIKSVVISTEVEAGFVEIDAIKGLFDDGESVEK